MTRALARTHLHSSKLIRVLSELTLVDAVEPGAAFAEKLSAWLNLNDAITLCATHNTNPTPPLAATPVTGAAIAGPFDRVRATLVQSITQESSPRGNQTRLERPAPPLDVFLDGAPLYEPYRRYYVAHQRDMELRIRPLRAQVREELGKASPALKTLAALDAVFDGILSDREGKWLSTLPSLMERRFGQLLKAHQQQLAEAQQADHLTLWMAPDGWLTRFRHELRTVLLAELEVRLLPTLGLIEAFNHTLTKHP